MTASAHHAAASGWDALIQYWWVALILISWLGEAIADRYNAGLRALNRRRKDKRKHELAKLKLQLQIAEAGNVTAIGQKKKPGPCVHRNVVPVMSADELQTEPIAWLCRSCQARLPADWAVREEDL